MTNQKKFVVGDIVMLKSGGPEMTVKETLNLEIESYRCQWFAGKKLDSGVFPADSLIPKKAE
jgi:uncharacterized protein YodC (DUF2158 family)